MTLRIADTAEDAAVEAHALLQTLRGHGKSKDQIARALESAVLNLEEGGGRFGKDKEFHYTVAYASAREGMRGLRLLGRKVHIDATGLASVLGKLDSVCAVTWTLIHRR